MPFIDDELMYAHTELEGASVGRAMCLSQRQSAIAWHPHAALPDCHRGNRTVQGIKRESQMFRYIQPVLLCLRKRVFPTNSNLRVPRVSYPPHESQPVFCTAVAVILTRGEALHHTRSLALFQNTAVGYSFKLNAAVHIQH